VFKDADSRWELRFIEEAPRVVALLLPKDR
jgi:hypothetical protein